MMNFDPCKNPVINYMSNVVDELKKQMQQIQYYSLLQKLFISYVFKHLEGQVESASRNGQNNFMFKQPPKFPNQGQMPYFPNEMDFSNIGGKEKDPMNFMKNMQNNNFDFNSFMNSQNNKFPPGMGNLDNMMNNIPNNFPNQGTNQMDLIRNLNNSINTQMNNNNPNNNLNNIPNFNKNNPNQIPQKLNPGNNPIFPQMPMQNVINPMFSDQISKNPKPVGNQQPMQGPVNNPNNMFNNIPQTKNNNYGMPISQPPIENPGLQMKNVNLNQMMNSNFNFPNPNNFNPNQNSNMYQGNSNNINNLNNQNLTHMPQQSMTNSGIYSNQQNPNLNKPQQSQSFNQTTGNSNQNNPSQFNNMYPQMFQNQINDFQKYIIFNYF